VSNGEATEIAGLDNDGQNKVREWTL